MSTNTDGLVIEKAPLRTGATALPRNTLGNKSPEEGRSILIVDDEYSICQLLSDFFQSQGYRTFQAFNGKVALERIPECSPEIIISDIRMPHMDGIELFRITKERYPGIKHILMTGYDIEEYLSLIRQHNIGNIMVKGADFNLREMAAFVKSILTGDVFGLERYFPGKAMERLTIDSYARSEEVCSKIAEKWSGEDVFYLRLAIDELIANAVFHGALRSTGITREQWRNDILLDSRQAISVSWAVDGEKIGVAVEDPQGHLKKVDALRWLDQSDNSGREVVEHGRGLYLVRRLIDRFIINIEPGRRTECIIMQYFSRNHIHRHKPLQINEI
jgi:CheY-like chemotaxis protein/anti-sigma regulatory factor (Ser/Thr protein kinase)